MVSSYTMLFIACLPKDAFCVRISSFIANQIDLLMVLWHCTRFSTLGLKCVYSTFSHHNLYHTESNF
ncbi:hypothetical protein T4D_2897 [Trichinella pseudospiralis]|uniref:Uncharacterized protein n=1 Tax=Trichinella pseudospiralis TaxID=6337 RepID=A0A0V1FCY8_TRIPS|nr:hypothetical protein T4D_2897 [Trichinella pseudospiralis]